MKFIKVTVLSSFLSPEGEKRMIGIGGINPETKKDQYGYTVEEWEDMKVPIPEDQTHHTDNIEEDIEFGDEDIEIIKSPAYFLAEDFKLVVDRDDFGYTIYLKDNYTLDVMESPRQVISKITKTINN